MTADPQHALIVSPHLDDAAFSVPEPMLALRESGWRVTLATVFTRSVVRPTGFALACQLDKGLAADVDYMALRRAEDLSFCQTLDLRPLHLDLPEAPHRGYEDVSALFNDRHEDDPARRETAERLSALITAEAPDLCFAPLGIGHHVDHQIVVEAMAMLDRSVLRYADQPYALKHPASAERALLASHFSHQLRWSTRIDRRQRAIDAITCYTSQLPFQFAGPAAMRSRLDAAFAAGTPLWRRPTDKVQLVHPSLIPI